MRVEELNLNGERILIRPLRIHKHTQIQQVPIKKKASVTKDDNGNLTLSELPAIEDVDKWEEVKQQVVSEVQKATVLVASDKSPFKVGDIVLYYHKMGIPFSHINNTFLIKWYDIIGTVINSNISEDGANLE